LTSCDLVGEGLDVPALGAVILLRPTQSLVLHMQQIGRGMRAAPGKSALIVLDHVGNLGRHGRPDFERIWTLDGVDKAAGLTRICAECGAVNKAGVECCEACGVEFPAGTGGGRRTPVQVSGDLAELSAERVAEIAAMSYRRVISARLSAAELHAYARMRGYKPGWVYYRLREMEASAA
jgi:superfamily II DNA or RNA helicase